MVRELRSIIRYEQRQNADRKDGARHARNGSQKSWPGSDVERRERRDARLVPDDGQADDRGGALTGEAYLGCLVFACVLTYVAWGSGQ